ncbi:MAG: vWA domain-containing protein [Anaerolineae bacterium]
MWVAFVFQSASAATRPNDFGAYIDNVQLTVNTVECAATATINTLTTDTHCYVPGATIGAFIAIGSPSSQSVRVEADLWASGGDTIWGHAERTVTAPGSLVLPVPITSAPAPFPGDYDLIVSVYDASGACLQDTKKVTVRVNPTCGSVTPPISVTPTPTLTVTWTPTRTVTPSPSVTRTPTPTASFGPTLCPGQSAHETKHIYLPPAPGRADIVFAFDASGSMRNEIGAAQTNAIGIMNDLAALIPDVQFGVMDFLDYPSDPYGGTNDHAYLLRQAVTGNRAAVQSAINAITTGYGGDEPEAYTRALYESYSDGAIGWRRDARRFVIMFGDSVAHDDNLNYGVPSPPYHAGATWRTGYAPSYLDPGRDGVPGTGDDLDLQTVLRGMEASGVTLLFVVPNHYAQIFPDLPSASVDTLYAYWQWWADQTGAGGDAVKLANAADLPTAIRNLVTSASSRISRLELLTDPPDYQSWLTVSPLAYTNLVIPPSGLTVDFEVDIRVPPGTAVGRDYAFAVRAIGDGAVYGGQGVVVHVPANCITVTPTRTATPTATWTPTPTVTPTCVPPRPSVVPECPPNSAPNAIRNPHFYDGNRSWGEYSRLGRELVETSDDRAVFEGPPGVATHELLYQMVSIPLDAQSVSFWVGDHGGFASWWGSGDPQQIPANEPNFLRASIYDMTLTTELVRLWQVSLVRQPGCDQDAPTYNLTADDLALVRGQTVAVVFEFQKTTTVYNFTAGGYADDIHLHVCSPSGPCHVNRDKTASPTTVQPGGEVTVFLDLAGLDGACLPARQPVDVMLAMDRSATMAGLKLAAAKTAAKGFLDRLDMATDQAGLASFDSSSGLLDAALTSSLGPVRAAIDSLVAGGTIRDMTLGINIAQSELAGPRHRTGATPIMIILSDGRPTTTDARTAAAAAKAAGTRIFTIGLGNNVDASLMRDVASSPTDYYYAPDAAGLDAVYQQIAGAIGGAPATNIVITDRLSPYVTLVPNSFSGAPPPSVSADGKTLTWRIPRLGLETRRWSYRVTMTQTAGTWPTNDYATATYTNSRGQPGSLTFPIPQVTVLPPAAKNPQVMCKDYPSDSGRVPSNPNGEAWWDSPDIWVRNGPDGVEIHQNPIAGQPNTVYVRVRNIGDAGVNDIRVHLYDAPGASNIRWPDDWVPEIGSATIPLLAVGQNGIVAIPWTPTNEGHYCFLARIEAPTDPITADGWVPFDNNLCQKNTQIIGGGASSGAVSVGNANHGSGYGSATISSPPVAPGTGVRATFTDPTVFNRWQGAGGTVTGGAVIPGTTSIQLGTTPTSPMWVMGQESLVGDAAAVVSATIDRIPFAGDEKTQIVFDVSTPAGADPPTLTVTQYVDGLAVGGNVLRPQAQPMIYLPLLTMRGP